VQQLIEFAEVGGEVTGHFAVDLIALFLDWPDQCLDAAPDGGSGVGEELIRLPFMVLVLDLGRR